ncbi:MAG: hypothetical protein EOM23_09345, partial [Candidatus Moranbacteria bacterium]|nr:hypothetical protein [Candidatus Moranbacteria bacterium]
LDTTDEDWLETSRRHSQKANYGMLDNHVEKLKREYILFPSVSPTSNPNCQKWCPEYQ